LIDRDFVHPAIKSAFDVLIVVTANGIGWEQGVYRRSVYRAVPKGERCPATLSNSVEGIAMAYVFSVLPEGVVRLIGAAWVARSRGGTGNPQRVHRNLSSEMMKAFPPQIIHVNECCSPAMVRLPT
jgi:hypothetical protein